MLLSLFVKEHYSEAQKQWQDMQCLQKRSSGESTMKKSISIDLTLSPQISAKFSSTPSSSKAKKGDIMKILAKMYAVANPKSVVSNNLTLSNNSSDIDSQCI